MTAEEKRLTARQRSDNRAVIRSIKGAINAFLTSADIHADKNETAIVLQMLNNCSKELEAAKRAIKASTVYYRMTSTAVAKKSPKKITKKSPSKRK